MGHIAAKDIYRELGKKIDNLSLRTPWNLQLYDILKELYSPDEAEIIIKMPYGFSSFKRIQKITEEAPVKLQKILENLCSKGLVFDVWVRDRYYYAPSPMMLGIFELTMMRTKGELDYKTWAELFYRYLMDKDSLYAANFQNGEKVAPIRTLPHESAIEQTGYHEILDYEKAVSLVEQFDKQAIGYCSCRHEKLHVGRKECQTPLDTCSAFGWAANFIIKHSLGREVSKSEMLENIARSKELGLVLNADNVKKNITFICHCCKCCCNALLSISKHGYENGIVTSSFIASIDEDKCVGCGRCAKNCPINAIEMTKTENPNSKTGQKAVIDNEFCLGCGVCTLKCKRQANRLKKRKKRVIHPETTFERVILQCLERGTLQNQIFDNPESVTQDFLRGIVGGFLRLAPIKKALMSDTLRSSFLKTMELGTRVQGKGWLIEL